MFSKILVKIRYILFVLTLAIMVVCAIFAAKVRVISDMTEYLPDDSSVKTGIRLMAEEFDTRVSPRYELVYEIGDTEAGSGFSFVIAAAASVIALVILFLLCRSLLEPFLVLFTAGIAAVINAGTNVFLGSVSGMTGAVAAILQLCLIAIWSVNLINQYRPGLSEGQDDSVAMTGAIGSACASIMSSSLIVIAGLLILACARSKFGTELGIVSAKGVFIGMVCFLTVFPTLILKFSKSPQTTAKKVSRVKRVFMVPLLLLFMAGMVFMGKARIRYSAPKQSEDTDTFSWSSNIVVLYDKEDEKRVKRVAEKLERNEAVESVTAYATTLGREYPFEEMTEKVQELSEDMEIAPWMMRLIYFDHGGYQIQPMPLGEYLRVLNEFSEEDPTFSADLDAFLRMAEKINETAVSVPPELLAQIETASLFTDRREYTKQRTTAELAQMFGVDESLLSKLLLLSGKKTVSLEELVKMLSSNAFVSSMLPPDITDKLYMVDILTNEEELSKKRTAKEISELFGIDRSLLSVMGDERMSIAELMQMAKTPPTLPNVTGMSGDDRIAWIQQIINDTEEQDRTYTPEEIANLFAGMEDGPEESRIKFIYKVHDSGNIQMENILSVEAFLSHMTVMSKSTEYEGLFDDEMKKTMAKVTGDLENEKRRFVGEEHAIMILSTDLSEESEDSAKLTKEIEDQLKKSMKRECYLIGDVPLQRELAKVFSGGFFRVSGIAGSGVYCFALIICVLPGMLAAMGKKT